MCIKTCLCIKDLVCIKCSDNLQHTTICICLSVFCVLQSSLLYVTALYSCKTFQDVNCAMQIYSCTVYLSYLVSDYMFIVTLTVYFCLLKDDQVYCIYRKKELISFLFFWKKDIFVVFILRRFDDRTTCSALVQFHTVYKIEMKTY